jgi:hypothetical protein
MVLGGECIVMNRNSGLAVGAALVLGAATASVASSPYGAQAISPSVPPQGTAQSDTTPPYALTGSPPPRASSRAEPDGWTWTVQRLGRRVVRVIPER